MLVNIVMNLSTSHPCPQTLQEAEFNDNGLTKLVEEDTRQSSIQVVHGYFCFVLVALGFELRA
jgi:hypothetical protein